MSFYSQEKDVVRFEGKLYWLDEFNGDTLKYRAYCVEDAGNGNFRRLPIRVGWTQQSRIDREGELVERGVPSDRIYPPALKE